MSINTTNHPIAVPLAIIIITAPLILCFCHLLFTASCARGIPGPWAARFLPLWRMWFVSFGSAHDGYRKMHQRYGPIVRTAPNVVDVADPAVISKICVGDEF